MTAAVRDADRDRLVAWLLVAAAVFGAADWIATWLLIGETAEGTKEVAGLSEGNLRALQNPATVLLLLALRGTRRRYGPRLGELGRTSFAVTAIALAIVLVGNIVEFGLWGAGPFDSQDPGAAIFFTGLLFLMFGLMLLVMALAGTAWRRARRQS